MFMEDKAKKVSLEMKPSTEKRADGESEKLLAKVVDLEDAEESQAKWNDKEELRIQDVVTGKVARMTDFGAFVELESGVDALLHVSQISRERVEKPQDVLSIGQEITAKVVDLNVDAKKISLSMKALANDEDQE